MVTKALEDARGAKVINKSQEAIVSVTAPQATLDALSAFDASVFEELFIVSGVTFAAGDELCMRGQARRGRQVPALLELSRARRQRQPRGCMPALRRRP